MDPEGNYGEKQPDDGKHGASSSLHTCPQPPYLPSAFAGKYEGNYGNHDAVINGVAGASHSQTMLCLQCGDPVRPDLGITIRSTGNDQLTTVHEGCLDASETKGPPQ